MNDPARRIPITGRTRLYGVIADPIAQVRACEVFNPRFEALGVDAVLVPFHVHPGELPRALDGFRALANLGGVLVTIPHKEAVLDLVDEVGAHAQLIGAANIFRRESDGRLTAENFDGLGFVAGLRAHGHAPEGKRALLVGAGGAAKAIAFALAEARVGELVIANRTAAKAAALAERVRAAYPQVRITAGPIAPSGFHLVINGTSLGLQAGDALPFPLEAVDPGAVVADIIMKPARTALLAAAEARGLSAHYGRHMLDEQVPLMARFLRAFPVEG
ncbi:MAG: shikimate dehydrogenase [Geminicoccaceae bacterium]|nr:MAG: shikimate dehydrogenase [Geminicoccaceae bacterium]